MINFLPKSAALEMRFVRLKYRVNLVTTLVLVAYVVAGSGLAGWWLFLAKKQETVTAEVADLNRRVLQLANVETVLFQVDARAKLVKQTLGIRKNSGTELRRLMSDLGDLQVTGWDYQAGMRQKLTLAGSDLAKLEAYADGLKSKFSVVAIDSAMWKPGGGWQMVVSLEGGKNK